MSYGCGGMNRTYDLKVMSPYCELDCLFRNIWTDLIFAWCQWVGSNHRPRRYECRALTSWATLACIKYNDGCGGMNRTYDLKVMSLASYHCSTPRYTNGMMSHYCELDCSTPRYMVFFWRRVIIWNSGICQYVFSQCGSDYVYAVVQIEYERALIVYPHTLFFIVFVH